MRYGCNFLGETVMNEFICGFKKFYDNDMSSLSKVMEMMKTRPYLTNLMYSLKGEDWIQFKAAQMDAFKAGYDYALSLSGKKETRAEESESETKQEERVVTDSRKQTESDKGYATAHVVADATCSDYEELVKWCSENGIKKHGRGYVLNRDDYRAWCDHIGYTTGRDSFPLRTLAE